LGGSETDKGEWWGPRLQKTNFQGGGGRGEKTDCLEKKSAHWGGSYLEKGYPTIEGKPEAVKEARWGSVYGPPKLENANCKKSV